MSDQDTKRKPTVKEMEGEIQRLADAISAEKYKDARNQYHGLVLDDLSNCDTVEKLRGFVEDAVVPLIVAKSYPELKGAGDE